MAEEEKKEPGTAANVADIGDRLSQHDREPGSEGDKKESDVIPEEPTPAFDLAKLTPEQLIGLKAALEGVPSRLERKKGNPIVRLRRIDGRFVADFKDSYTEIYEDPNTHVRGERVMIPTQFMGDVNPDNTKKFTPIVYKDFMHAEQVKCEVISTRSEEGSYSEGEVESNERPGVIVEMLVKTVKTFFTVKLPAGSTPAQIELESRIANA